MKKITLLLIAGLMAMIAQAGVINQDKAAKLQNAKANVAVKAEGDIVTPPADAELMLYNFQGHDTYVDKDKAFEVFVVIDNNDVYVKGLSEYLTDGWVKGTIADGVATFPAAYMGIFEFWGDAYELNFDGATFTVNDDASELTAPDGYTTSVEGEILDEFINVTLTKAVAEIATPATPTITEFTEDDYGHYVKMTIPAKDVDGNDIFAALLSYQLLVDRNGEQRYQLKPTAISEVNTNNVVETNYYDLQGRKVDANTTGLLIKQMRMQDGTTRAVKVMR